MKEFFNFVKSALFRFPDIFVTGNLFATTHKNHFITPLHLLQTEARKPHRSTTEPEDFASNSPFSEALHFSTFR